MTDIELHEVKNIVWKIIEPRFYFSALWGNFLKYPRRLEISSRPMYPATCPLSYRYFSSVGRTTFRVLYICALIMISSVSLVFTVVNFFFLLRMLSNVILCFYMLLCMVYYITYMLFKVFALNVKGKLFPE